MTAYYADDWLTVYLGDCREVMASMEPESVHCVVTSPPYWSLRDYGVEGQLGLEPTPEQYVENMVAVFREVRRVLRSDGTVWLNLGDSYAASTGQQTITPQTAYATGRAGGDARGPARKTLGYEKADGGFRDYGRLKPKDLVGIPWRVAFALQADGWYLRSDIIWSKPNPMPESVTDRPTKSHEYLFLLSKSPRYYFDADAVRERAEATPQRRLTPVSAQPSAAARVAAGGHNPTSQGGTGTDRNIRSVWTIATQPYPGAHFATFPRKLVEPCIKAGTSERGVCPECGAPWERVVERQPSTSRTGGDGWQDGRSEQIATGRRGRSRPGSFTPAIRPHVDDSTLDRYGTGEAGVHRKVGGQYQKWLDANPPETVGWRPTCSSTCDYAEADHQSPVPATVLDPFAGSGTTGLVAQSLSRRAVLIDLNADYLGQVLDRNRDIPLGLGA